MLDGDPAPPPVKGHSLPIFGQCPLWSNGWKDYKVPLGMEVGLGPGDFVFDGDPAIPPEQRAHPPPPMFIVAKRLDG